MPTDEHYKRIAVLVPIELYHRMNRCFEWGERNRTLVRMIEWLCEKIETHGQSALMLILREGHLDDLVKKGLSSLENGEDDGHNR